MTDTLAYLLDGKIYINLTNACTNNCIFCLRNDKDDVCGAEMWLNNENHSAKEVIEQVENIISNICHPELVSGSYADEEIRFRNEFGMTFSSEITFCGYGEPTLKLDILKEVAKYLKEKYPNVKLRINTNGHVNYIYKRNIIPELKGLIDTISVSLNGENEEEYNKYSNPKFDNAYGEVKKFIKASSDAGINTVATVVDGYKGQRLNLEKCEQIAAELGAKFRVREWIENGYS